MEDDGCKKMQKEKEPKMRDVITGKLFGEYNVTYWKDKKYLKAPEQTRGR